jgi:putative transposase
VESRSWAATLEPGSTCQVLADSSDQLPELHGPATLYADSGIENVNGDINALLDLGKLHRVLAEVEVSFSNSMIESWWRSLKSNWIYINQLDSFAAPERPVSFYVSEHKTRMPHAAFHGQTPDEIYYGRGDDVPDHLAEARRRARQMRLETNRDLSCEACLTVTAVGPSEAVPSAEREPQ